MESDSDDDALCFDTDIVTTDDSSEQPVRHEDRSTTESQDLFAAETQAMNVTGNNESDDEMLFALQTQPAAYHSNPSPSGQTEDPACDDGQDDSGSENLFDLQTQVVSHSAEQGLHNSPTHEVEGEGDIFDLETQATVFNQSDGNETDAENSEGPNSPGSEVSVEDVFCVPTQPVRKRSSKANDSCNDDTAETQIVDKEDEITPPKKKSRPTLLLCRASPLLHSPVVSREIEDGGSQPPPLVSQQTIVNDSLDGSSSPELRGSPDIFMMQTQAVPTVPDSDDEHDSDRLMDSSLDMFAAQTQAVCNDTVESDEEGDGEAGPFSQDIFAAETQAAFDNTEEDPDDAGVFDVETQANIVFDTTKSSNDLSDSFKENLEACIKRVSEDNVDTLPSVSQIKSKTSLGEQKLNASSEVIAEEVSKSKTVEIMPLCSEEQLLTPDETCSVESNSLHVKNGILTDTVKSNTTQDEGKELYQDGTFVTSTQVDSDTVIPIKQLEEESAQNLIDSGQQTSRASLATDTRQNKQTPDTSLQLTSNSEVLKTINSGVGDLCTSAFTPSAPFTSPSTSTVLHSGPTETPCADKLVTPNSVNKGRKGRVNKSLTVTLTSSRPRRSKKKPERFRDGDEPEPKTFDVSDKSQQNFAGKNVPKQTTESRITVKKPVNEPQSAAVCSSNNSVGVSPEEVNVEVSELINKSQPSTSALKQPIEKRLETTQPLVVLHDASNRSTEIDIRKSSSMNQSSTEKHIDIPSGSQSKVNTPTETEELEVSQSEDPSATKLDEDMLERKPVARRLEKKCPSRQLEREVEAPASKMKLKDKLTETPTSTKGKRLNKKQATLPVDSTVEASCLTESSRRSSRNTSSAKLCSGAKSKTLQQVEERSTTELKSKPTSKLPKSSQTSINEVKQTERQTRSKRSAGSSVTAEESKQSCSLAPIQPTTNRPSRTKPNTSQPSVVKTKEAEQSRGKRSAKNPVAAKESNRSHPPVTHQSETKHLSGKVFNTPQVSVNETKEREGQSNGRRSVRNLVTAKESTHSNLPVIEQHTSEHSSRDRQSTANQIESTSKKSSVNSQLTNNSKTSKATRISEQPLATTKQTKEKRVGRKRASKEETVRDTSAAIDVDGSISERSSLCATPTKRSRTSQARAYKSTSQSTDVSSNNMELPAPQHRLRTTQDTPSLIKVMFTGISDTASLEKIVTGLGCSTVTDITKCTHLITNEAKRTIKFLCAVSQGLNIVTSKWLIQSQKAGKCLDIDKYCLHDAKSEKMYKYSLSNSIQVARETGGLLAGYRICVTKNTRPPPAEIKDIVVSAGGKFHNTIPKTSSPDLYIVSCNEDIKVYKPLLAAGFHIVDKEFLLTGVLRQVLSPSEFKLS